MPKRKPLSTQVITRETAGEAFGLDWLPKPDRILNKLGKSQMTAYADVTTDDQLSAVRESRNAGTKKVKWMIDRNGASSRAFKVVEEVFERLDSPGDHDISGIARNIDDILRANGYGMSPMQVYWPEQPINGLWLPLKLQGMPPEWFIFDQENNLKFLTAESPTTGEPVEPHKIILARNNPDFDNPYGDALLSKCYWPVIFKRNSIIWWNRFTEKFGMPWIHGKMPRVENGDTETNKLLEILTEAVQNAVIITPTNTDVELIDPGSKSGSSDLYKTFVWYMDNAIAKIWLGEAATTDMQDKGSRAAVEVLKEVSDERVEADKEMVIRTFDVLIKWICDLNFPAGNYPKFTFIENQKVNKDIAERDGINAEKQGVRLSKSYFMRVYGYEEDEIEIVEPTAPGNDGDPGENAPGKDKEKEDKTALSFALKEQITIEQAIDALTKPDILQKQVEQVLAPVIKLIQDSADYSVAQEKLVALWPQMNTDEVSKWMQRAIFAGEATGRLSA